MSTGTGIAILAVWLPVCACLLAKEVPGPTVALFLIIALIMTMVFKIFG